MANGSDDKLVIETAGLGFDNLVRDLDRLQAELSETAERAKKVDADPIDIDTSKARRRIEELRDDFNRFRATADDPIEIEARTRQAQKEIGEVRKHLTEVGKAARSARAEVVKIEKGAGHVNALTKSFQRLNQAINAIVLIKVAQWASESVAILADFGDKMSAVGAISGATGEELERLEARAREMGATTRFSATEAAEGMKFLSQAGLEVDDVYEALPGTLKLAQAGALGLADAADIATNVMSGFGVGAESLGRIVDVLAVTAASSNTSVGQLGEGMAKAAPIARALGISVEETSTLLGIFANAGLQAEEGGTGLRRVIAALSNVTPRAEAALRKMGLSVDDVNPSMVSMTDIIKRLADGGLTAEKAFAIFGRQGATSILALTGQVDEIDKLRKKVDEAAGAADRMAKLMDENLKGAVLRTKSAFQELILTVGDKATPAMARFLEVLTGSGRESGSLAKFIGSLVGSLTDAISIVLSSVENGANLVIESFKFVQNFIQDGALGIIEFITGIVAKIPGPIGEAAEKIRETMNRLGLESEKEWQRALDNLSRDSTRAKNNIAKSLVGIRDAWVDSSKGAKTLGDESDKAADASVAAADRIATSAEELGRILSDAARESADDRIEAEDEVLRAALESFDKLTSEAELTAEGRKKIKEGLAADLQAIEEELAEKTREILAEVDEAEEEGAEERVRALSEAQEKIVALEDEAAKKREDAIKRHVDAVKKAADEEIAQLERVKKAQEDLAKSLDDLFDESEKAGKAGEGGDKGGRKLPVEDAVERVREDVEALRSELEGLQFGGEGTGLDPSRILEVARAYNDATLGVSDFADGADAAQSEYEDATASMRENAEKLGEKIRELVTKNEAFAAIFPTLSSAAQESIGAIVAEFGNLDEGAQLSEETVRTVEAALRELTGTTDGAGTGAETLAGRLRDLAGEADTVTEASERSAEAIRGAADGIEFSGEATEKARKGLERWKDEARDAADEVEGAGEQAADAAEGIKAGGEAAAEASEGVGQLSEVAEKAKDNVGAVADAAERLSGVELPPELPEQLAGLGQAAAATTEAAGPLGDALVLVNAQIGEIRASVESLAERAPELTALIEEGGAKLAELIEGETLKTIGEQVATLKEGLDGVGPLVEQVATALTTIGEQGQPVADSAALIREALTELGSDELVGKVQAIVDVLQALPEPLEKSAQSSGEVAENIGKLSEFADRAKDSLEGLVALFGERLPESVKATADAINEARNEVSGLKSAAQDAAQAITDGMEEARQALQGATQDAQALAAALRDAAAAQRELNDATNEANPDEG